MTRTVIEFFGTPGSGKTFVAEALLESMRQRGQPANERALRLARAGALTRMSSKLRLAVGGLFGSGDFRRQVSRLLGESSVAEGARRRKLSLNWGFLHALVAAEPDAERAVVLDQGFAQALWSSLFYGTQTPRQETAARCFREIMESLSLEALHIIHVQAHSDLLQKRIGKRGDGKSPLDRDAANLARAERTTGDTRALLQQVAARVPGITIHDLENNGEGLDQAELARIGEMVFDRAQTG